MLFKLLSSGLKLNFNLLCKWSNIYLQRLFSLIYCIVIFSLLLWYLYIDICFDNFILQCQLILRNIKFKYIELNINYLILFDTCQHLLFCYIILCISKHNRKCYKSRNCKQFCNSRLLRNRKHCINNIYYQYCYLAIRYLLFKLLGPLIQFNIYTSFQYTEVHIQLQNNFVFCYSSRLHLYSFDSKFLQLFFGL